jgi:hypothetical protein
VSPTLNQALPAALELGRGVAGPVPPVTGEIRAALLVAALDDGQPTAAESEVDQGGQAAADPDLTKTVGLSEPGAQEVMMVPPRAEGDLPASEAQPAPVKPAALYLSEDAAPIVIEETSTVPVEMNGRTYQRWEVPRDRAGHHLTTPAFGQAGNATIVGHSIWYGQTGVFEPLLSLDVGDLIRGVNDDGSSYSYQVTRRWSSPYEDNSWLRSPEDPHEKRLTLYTCNSDLTALVVVQAELAQEEGAF